MEEYVAHITTTQKIKDVIIDPTNRLADINKLDNSWKCPVTLTFDSQISNYKDWKNYTMKWRPEIWGNSYDGLKAGIYFNGDYFGYKHKLEFTAWYNTGIAKRIAQELKDGYYVNLGIGIPTLVANYIPEGMDITFQSEYGMLGMGPFLSSILLI